MILFPAIDILGGKVVRLQQGDYNRVDVYGDDPVAMACEFAQAGCQWVHVVDLDAARGDTGVNDDVIKRLCDTHIGIEVGGGVRSFERIEELSQAGVGRLVLGTRLARDPLFAQTAGARYGDLLVAGVDARDGKVSVQGWQEDTNLDALDFIAGLASWGYRHLVYTDIARDGMQSGIDVKMYEEVSRAAGFPVVASGGLTNLDDFIALKKLGADIVEGAITGRALYEGNFTLAQALAACDGRTL